MPYARKTTRKAPTRLREEALAACRAIRLCKISFNPEPRMVGRCDKTPSPCSGLNEGKTDGPVSPGALDKYISIGHHYMYENNTKFDDGIRRTDHNRSRRKNSLGRRGLVAIARAQHPEACLAGRFRPPRKTSSTPERLSVILSLPSGSTTSGHPISLLAELLEQEQVLTHPFILGEIACGNLKKRREIVDLMQALPAATKADDQEILFLLRNGLSWGAASA